MNRLGLLTGLHRDVAAVGLAGRVLPWASLNAAIPRTKRFIFVRDISGSYKKEYLEDVDLNPIDALIFARRVSQGSVPLFPTEGVHVDLMRVMSSVSVWTYSSLSYSAAQILSWCEPDAIQKHIRRVLTRIRRNHAMVAMRRLHVMWRQIFGYALSEEIFLLQARWYFLHGSHPPKAS